MPRNYKSTAVFVKPDPKLGSMIVSKFINKLMLHGKKSTAQAIFYEALDIAAKQITDCEDQLEIFTKALENVRPMVEVRSKRVGGANYQVPMQVNQRRRLSLCFRWIINAARAESGKPMRERLAKELYDAARGEGKAMQTRDQTHRMAEANKAFAHFAW